MAQRNPQQAYRRSAETSQKTDVSNEAGQSADGTREEHGSRCLQANRFVAAAFVCAWQQKLHLIYSQSSHAGFWNKCHGIVNTLTVVKVSSPQPHSKSLQLLADRSHSPQLPALRDSLRMPELTMSAAATESLSPARAVSHDAADAAAGC